jgi:hypothetical protein
MLLEAEPIVYIFKKFTNAIVEALEIQNWIWEISSWKVCKEQHFESKVKSAAAPGASVSDEVLRWSAVAFPLPQGRSSFCSIQMFN